MRLRLPVARIVSVLLFAALCAIVAGWALQLLAPRPPIAPAGAVASAQVPSDLSIAGRLFGAPPATDSAGSALAAAPSNIQVTGVVAAGARSVALLAVDGRPAKPFAVGDAVAGGLKVRSVAADAVVLEGSGAPMRLPAPPRGSIDVLTSGPQRTRTDTAAIPPVGIAPGGVPTALVPPAAGMPALPPLPPRPLPPSGAAAGTPQGDVPPGVGPTGAVGVPGRIVPSPGSFTAPPAPGAFTAPPPPGTFTAPPPPGAFTAPPPPEPGQPGQPPGQ